MSERSRVRPKKRVRIRTRPTRAGLVLVWGRIVAFLVVLAGLAAAGLAYTGRLPGFERYSVFVDDISVTQARSSFGRVSGPVRPITEAAGIYAHWDETGKVTINGQAVPVRYVGGKAWTDLSALANRLGWRISLDRWKHEVRIETGRPKLAVLETGSPTEVYMDGPLLSERSVKVGADVFIRARVVELAFGEILTRGPAGEVFLDGRAVVARNRSGQIYVQLAGACSIKGFGLTNIALNRYMVETGAPILAPPVAAAGQAPPAAIKSVPAAGNLVALTFDDDLKPDTAKLLEILERKKAAATFFISGRSAALEPAILSRLVADGFELGNHAYDHALLNELSDPDEVRAEILGGRRAIYAAAKRDPVLFRPPGGGLTPAVEKAIWGSGQKLVLWSVDVADYRSGKTAAAITQGVARGAAPGAIILLHNAPEATIEALPAIVDELRAKGFQLVTVSELMAKVSQASGGGSH